MAFENSIPFIDYCRQIKGVKIRIDNKRRCVEILTERNTVVTVHLSKSITQVFTVADLLKTEHLIGDKTYHVYTQGDYNIHWLFVLLMGDIL